MGVDMKRANETKIDLTGWSFGFGDELDAVICPRVAEALTDAFDDPRHFDNIYIDLPAQWGEETDGYNGPGQEPLTIYVSLPLGKDDNSSPIWKADFGDMIDDLIDGCLNPQAMKITDDEGRAVAARMRDALLAQAEKLSQACEPPL